MGCIGYKNAPAPIHQDLRRAVHPNVRAKKDPVFHPDLANLIPGSNPI